MQWIHIVPRKARPICQVCNRRARWRCEYFLNAKSNQTQPWNFPAIAVCDLHKQHSEATYNWLQAVSIADPKSQERIYYYLSRGGHSVVVALATILLSENCPLQELVLQVCIVGGDDFVRLLAQQVPNTKGPLTLGFIQGVLRIIEREKPSIAREGISLLGLCAKHGVSGSIEALRRCSQTEKAPFRALATRLLEEWETASQVIHPYRLGSNRAVVFPVR